ncbi:hypothetical protein RHODGE_RHODGE_00472 [Rhodoplanes serenus]|uniref:Protochlamydia outer membrane protein domain-containing protein n=1 Tax=Rhodoplanes serenus TaxID=200615 RepID=A0A3S4FAM1_9BRAD|nr:hypothetical protein [Rhodoplanes serenus]VCU07374.1 hypothetical protein RHODGE_RHODGE_00472 [Rhodoplanes serenus]
MAIAATVTASMASAAEWPRLPPDPPDVATVWDPGPRWPTLPPGHDEAAAAARAAPPRPARPKTRPAVETAGDLGPQWPRIETTATTAEAAAPDTDKPETTGAFTPVPAAPARRAAVTPPAAAVPVYRPTYPVPAAVVARPFVIEVGGRYWYSSGKADFGFRNGYPGYGDPTSTLDWRDTAGHAGEVFGRVDHRPTGFFVKGLIGAGTLGGGTIVDRDFFAGQVLFSDTSSDIRGDSLNYGIVDAGWSFDVPGARFRVGGFVGWHYWRESLTAYGLTCNPDQVGGVVCGPPGSVQAPSTTAVLAYEPTWQALRLGIDGRWTFMPGWSVSGEVAYMPIAHLENKDSHLLRQDFGPGGLGPAPNIISRSSQGRGVAAEVFLNYAVTPAIEIGVGGRFWGLNADTGTVAFGPSFASRFDLTKFEQQRYGLLVQAKGRF